MGEADQGCRNQCKRIALLPRAPTLFARADDFSKSNLSDLFHPALRKLLRFDESDSWLEQRRLAKPALRPHRLAIELRHRGWVAEKRRDETLAWFSERGVAFVSVDAPRADQFQIMPSELDAVTDDSVAYWVAWRPRIRMTSRFCVRASDTAGNAAVSCAPLRVR